MRNIEVESKYYANDINMKDFNELVQDLLNPKFLHVSSFDSYYSKEGVDDSFLRYRYGNETGELTVKKKLTQNNNIFRTEVNIPLRGATAESDIREFASVLGLTHNFTIYKTASIAFSEDVVVAYYIVYDPHMKELNKFIEIEANEHKHWKDEKQAFAAVKRFEKLLSPLGISSKNRIKESLFELYRKPLTNI